MVRIKFSNLILFVASLFIASSLYAQTEKVKIPVVVNGDRVEYFQDEQKVIGTGNVDVTYEDIKLTCNKMTVYLDTKDAIAEGGVKLYQEGNVYSGEKVIYNFEKKIGEVIDGKMNAPPWYGSGELIRKTGATEYSVEKGYITTCDHAPPHYKIQSNKVNIFLGEKLTARNTVMYIGNVPILYIPFYTHLLTETKPQVSVTPGFDKKWGGFALTKWRYHLNDYMKGYLHLDYREKKDFAWGFDHKYDTKHMGEGLLQTYYMNERSIHSDRIWDDHDPPTTELERYKIQLRHRWDVNDDAYINAEYHKFSDFSFLKDYFYRDYERDSTPPTYISALYQKPLYSAELRADKRANHYETVVEYLPEFNLDIGENRLFDTNFYYKSENRISNIDKKYGDNAEEDLDVFRFDTYDEISYLVKLFGFLSINPYVATRQTYFSKDKWGEEDLIRGMFYTGIDTSTRFYKIFNYQTDFLGLDINGLRHIVNPVVKYYYNHHPTILPNNLMQLDEFDNMDRDNGVKLELENKLQTKRKINDKLETIDLARLLLSTDYLFKAEQGSEFTDFNGEAELRPYQWMYMEAEATYDHLKSKIEKGSWDLITHDPISDKWSFSLGQRYELEHSSQLTSEVSYEIDPKWRLKVYERFQFKEKELQEQEYSITRDLHCWTAEFIYNKCEDEGHTFWFVLRLKAFREAPLKVSTSYHGPRANP